MPPKKSSAKKSPSTLPQCRCFTVHGTRCKRKSASVDGFCKQHSKKCSFTSEEAYKASKKKTSERKKKSQKGSKSPQLLAIEDKKPQLLAIEDKKQKPKPNLPDFRVSHRAQSIGGSSVFNALKRLEKR